jgi:hypothetical protein
VAKAKKYWTTTLKKKENELKDLDLYIKPEEGKVYLVFNKKITGEMAF